MACMNLLRRTKNPSFYFRNLVVKYSSQDILDDKNELQLTEDNLSSSNILPSKLTSIKNEGEQFRYLLRHSNFINLGDPENKVVLGKIFHVVYNDLYIDFGWKFYCVCSRPTKEAERYVRGAKVKIKIKDLELSSKFLGSLKEITLLEAEAIIIQLIDSPIKKTNENSKRSS